MRGQPLLIHLHSYLSQTAVCAIVGDERFFDYATCGMLARCHRKSPPHSWEEHNERFAPLEREEADASQRRHAMQESSRPLSGVRGLRASMV